jgi:hypothetical protein
VLGRTSLPTYSVIVEYSRFGVYIKREMKFERVIFADEFGVPVPSAGKRRHGRPRLPGRRGKKTGNFTFSS